MSKAPTQKKINQVIGKTALAKKSFMTADGFTNFQARIGLGAGSIQDKSTMNFNFISRNRIMIEAAYRSNWICGLACDLVAQDMTRAGIEIEGEIDPDDIKKLQRKIKRMKLMDSWRDLIKWSRLYGGAIGVLMIDGQDLSTPLNHETIGKDQFKGMLVLDRWLVNPSLSDLVTEMGPDIGRPKYYTVLADAQALVNMKIHYTRIIRMEGVELPYWQRITENGWGQSVLERIWDRVVAFDSVSEGAAQLVYKAHLRVFKVKGLKDIKALGGDKTYQGFLAYWEAIRQFQSNEGLTLIDTDDEFIPHTYSFTGLADMAIMFGEQLSGGLQIPLVRLFGQSPAGLNSTGESDLVTYYDNVQQQQEAKMSSGMSRMMDILYRSTFGEAPPEDFDFDFKSLKEMNQEEKSKIAASTCDAILKAEENGVITRAVALRELKQLSHSVGIFSNITDEDIEDAENDPPLSEQLSDQMDNSDNEAGNEKQTPKPS